MRRTLIVSAIICSLAASACASTPEAAEESIAEGPAMTVGEAYRSAQAYLPAHAQIAYATVHEGSGWDAFGDDLLPVANPDAEPGQPGTVEALKADLEAMTTEMYGVDLSKSEAMVMAGGLDGELGGVWFGDFGEPQGLQTVEVAGRDAYEVDITEMTQYLGDDAPQIAYMMELDGTRPGLVWRLDTTSLEAVVDGSAVAEGGELLAGLFDDAGSAKIAIGAAVGELAQAGGGTQMMPVPDAAVMALGEERVTVGMVGDDQRLDQLASMVDQFVAEAQHQTSTGYENVDTSDSMAMFTIYTYHVVEGIAPQLAPTRGDGKLRYDVELTGSQLAAFLSLGVAGGGVYIQQEMEAANERTAQMEIRQLEQLVEIYYMSTSPHELPEELEELTRGPSPIIEELPLDPWGNDYVYIRQGETEFEVFSRGPDGEAERH